MISSSVDDTKSTIIWLPAETQCPKISQESGRRLDFDHVVNRIYITGWEAAMMGSAIDVKGGTLNFIFTQQPGRTCYHGVTVWRIVLL